MNLIDETVESSLIARETSIKEDSIEVSLASFESFMSSFNEESSDVSHDLLDSKVSSFYEDSFKDSFNFIRSYNYI